MGNFHSVLTLLDVFSVPREKGFAYLQVLSLQFDDQAIIIGFLFLDGLSFSGSFLEGLSVVHTEFGDEILAVVCSGKHNFLVYPAACGAAFLTCVHSLFSFRAQACLVQLLELEVSGLAVSDVLLRVSAIHGGLAILLRNNLDLKIVLKLEGEGFGFGSLELDLEVFDNLLSCLGFLVSVPDSVTSFFHEIGRLLLLMPHGVSGIGGRGLLL